MQEQQNSKESETLDKSKSFNIVSWMMSTPAVLKWL